MGLRDIGGNMIANKGIEDRLDNLWRQNAAILIEMQKQTALLERIARQNGDALWTSA